MQASGEEPPVDTFFVALHKKKADGTVLNEACASALVSFSFT